MSRRIVMLATVASAFIAATPAYAIDRDCYAGSCRIPNVTTVRPPGAPISTPPAVVTSPTVMPQPLQVGPAPSASVTIVGPPALYVDEGVLLAYPNFYPDPAWKLCQIDPTSHRNRYFYCGPYSYHPYGSLGYRPLGTYRPYRAAPIVMQAPSAKIININGDD